MRHALRWTWDPDKATANRIKHGLSFETALHVFDDQLQASQPVSSRMVIAGIRSALSGRYCCLVIHTWPEAEFEGEEPVGRIISARKATARERKAYEEGEASKQLKREQLAEPDSRSQPSLTAPSIPQMRRTCWTGPVQSAAFFIGQSNNN